MTTGRLAVDPICAKIAHPGSQCVSHPRPQKPGLLLVRHDDLGLDPDVPLHELDQRLCVVSQDRVEVGRNPVEQGGIPNHGVLDALGDPAPHLARRQGPQRVDVDRHEPRLIEAADEILSDGQVHCDLAPDPGVDHRDERRRALDERYAAGPGGGHEVRGIADDTATEGDERAATLEASGGQDLVNPPYGVEVLPRLPALYRMAEHRESGSLQRRPKGPAETLGNARMRYPPRPCMGSRVPHDRPESIDETRLNAHLEDMVGQGDGDDGHGHQDIKIPRSPIPVAGFPGIDSVVLVTPDFERRHVA